MNLFEDWWAIGLTLPEPVALTIAMTAIVPTNYLQSGADAEYASALNRSFANLWPALLVNCLLGLGCAGVCYRRQRTYAASWTWIWMAFVFLGGIPGLLAYLAHRSWPARLVCDSCKVTTPRDREACAACGAPFPEPRMQGIELIQPTA